MEFGIVVEDRIDPKRLVLLRSRVGKLTVPDRGCVEDHNLTAGSVVVVGECLGDSNQDNPRRGVKFYDCRPLETEDLKPELLSSPCMVSDAELELWVKSWIRFTDEEAVFQMVSDGALGQLLGTVAFEIQVVLAGHYCRRGKPQTAVKIPGEYFPWRELPFALYAERTSLLPGEEAIWVSAHASVPWCTAGGQESLSYPLVVEESGAGVSYQRLFVESTELRELLKQRCNAEGKIAERAHRQRYY